MHSSRELYELWAPPAGTWSPWVAPTVFNGIRCGHPAEPLMLPTVDWKIGEGQAVVLDLPGDTSILTALALAQQGRFRPVPVINACAPPVDTLAVTPASWPTAVTLTAIWRALCDGTALLPDSSAEGSPVFALDSERLKSVVPLEEDTFDNRWMVFPQDFPSARFLKNQGIASVLLVQSSGDVPQEDLAHVLLRWQEAGMPISVRSLDQPRERPANIHKPSRYRSFWHRWFAMIGLRPNSTGGFGDFIPSSTSG
jgi:hypothetical protein